LGEAGEKELTSFINRPQTVFSPSRRDPVGWKKKKKLGNYLLKL
jgi:hypothetical protein